MAICVGNEKSRVDNKALMRAENDAEIQDKKRVAGCIGIRYGDSRKGRNIVMVVSGVNGTGGAGIQAGVLGRGQAEDAVSKRLMQQIENAQKQLQEISGNSEMSTEEKMKKRQEIQKEISELNSQLRQHQMEMQKKEAEEAKKKQAESASAAERSGDSRKENVKNGQVDVQISAEGMQAMISADGAMKQAKVQGSVANSMEGRAGVLEVEIKLDGARNGDTSAKEAQLADVRQKAGEAEASQMRTLAEVGEALSEADKAEAAGTRKEDAEETDDKKERKDNEAAAGMEESGREEDKGVSEGYYVPVDVRI